MTERKAGGRSIPRSDFEMLKQRVASRAAAQPSTDVSPAASPYHQAAAVLAWFELNPTLQPVGRNAAEDRASQERLVSDSIGWADATGRHRWTLKSDVRKRVLAELGTADRILACVAANPSRPDDLLQRTFESCLARTLPAVEEQSAQELSATLQVLDWLPNTLPRSSTGLPTIEAVRRRIDIVSLRAPFESIASTATFRGRKNELAALREYIEVLPPTSVKARVVRAVRQIRSLKEKPPLMIWGPGGMGKSTLLARLILDHTTGEGPSLPFVYLDWDRPGLIPEEPLTLLVEAVRQLRVQFPESTSAADSILSYYRQELARVPEDTGSADGPIAASRYRGEFVQRFAAFIADVGIGESPLLLVLDTFEEVQTRGHAYTAQVWAFLGELQQVLPRLRTVVVGRAQVRDVAFEDLPLKQLDPEASESVLHSLGVTDARVAQVVAKQLRYNPLSLKLAAHVLRFEDAEGGGVKDIDTGGLFKRVDDAVVQGQLFRRILSHLRTEDVRRLAYPGLILRRVTAELIKEVLAEPCGVEVPTLQRANELLDALRREVSLVASLPGNDSEVRHRTDVRRVMLDLLRKEDKARAEKEGKSRVEAVERLAVEYYERKDPTDIEARAEEIYHRLGLKQDPDVIERRWLPGVEEYLRNAVDDFSEPEQQAFLASRLGIEVQTIRPEDLSLTVWEAMAEKAATDLLRVNRPAEALDLLERRTDRSPASALHALQARVLEQLGRLREARIEAATAIAKAPPDASAAILECYLVVARADGVLGQAVEVGDVVAQYERIATRYPQDARVLTLGLAWLASVQSALAAPNAPFGQNQDFQRLRRAISDVVRGMPIGAARDNPALFDQVLQSEVIDDPELRTVIRARRETGLVAETARATNESMRRRAQLEQTVVLDKGAQQQLELTSLLAEAFPSRSEVQTLLTNAFGKGVVSALRSGATATETLLLALTWANENGRLGALVAAATELIPNNERLNALVSRLELLSYQSDPVEALVVRGGRPFIGRPVLRQFLREVASPTGARVLTIDGPDGCGKSYSSVLIDHVASATRKFNHVRVDLAEHPDLSRVRDMAQIVALQIGLNPELLPRQSELDPSTRFTRDVADWLLGSVAKSQMTHVIVLDGFDRTGVSSELRDFVAALTQRVTRSSFATFRIVLLGSSPMGFQPDGASASLHEVLTPFDELDVAAYFSAVVPPNKRPSVEVGPLVQWTMDRASGVPLTHRQAAISDAVADITRELLRGSSGEPLGDVARE